MVITNGWQLVGYEITTRNLRINYTDTIESSQSQEILNLHSAHKLNLNMAEVRLFAELQETKAELQRLRERVAAGTQTVHKDLPLVYLVPKWSGSQSGIPLEEFLSSIEGAAQIGLWDNSERLTIAALRLTDGAKQFYNGCLELHSPDADWQNLKLYLETGTVIRILISITF